MHAIVSSALIPDAVAKCLQETHHVAPSQAAPTLAYMPGIVVGGPSCAPVSISTTVASFNGSGTAYQKVELPKTAQAFTGFTGKPSPNTYAKAMVKKSTPPPPNRVEEEAIFGKSIVTQSTAPLAERIMLVASRSNITLDVPLANLPLQE